MRHFSVEGIEAVVQADINIDVIPDSKNGTPICWWEPRRRNPETQCVDIIH